MNLFFTTLSGEHRLILSCILPGAPSGGAEDPYVCGVFGGEDGCDGEEEEVRVVGTKGKTFGTRALVS